MIREHDCALLICTFFDIKFVENPISHSFTIPLLHVLAHLSADFCQEQIIKKS